MASFLISLSPRTSLAVGFLYPYGLPSLSVRGVPVHSNINQSIVYEISNHWLLQYWIDKKLTHKADWEVSDLSPFEREWGRTKFHMSHFITKRMSNTQSNMMILNRRGHTSTNL